MEKGLIHLYLGDGKGKTTAAIGLAIRAAGRKRKVVFAQFLKGRKTGEIAPLKGLGVHVIRSEKNKGFFCNMNEDEKAAFRGEQTRILDEVKEAVFGVRKTADGANQVDLVVLDEAVDTLALKVVDDEALRDFVMQKPEGMELVITGRSAPDWLMEKADYITEMKKVKHPYDRGIVGREGIEY